MLSARVPAELKDLVDADKRDNQDIIRAALWREFGGERKSDIERRIEEKENRLSMIKREKNEREREIQREEQELEALREKLNAVETATEQIDDRLDQLLDEIETDGIHIYPESEPVTELAREFDSDPDDIIARMKKRAADRDMHIYQTQFMRADMARGTDAKLITEVYDDE